jgi:hypothetical protein
MSQPAGSAIPLAHWADQQLTILARASGSTDMAALSGAGLLAERALLNGFSVPGDVSAGGGCRLLQAVDASVALNLSRPDDRELLPALLQTINVDGNDDEDIARHMLFHPSEALIARGREMGLAIAGVDEDRSGASPAVDCTLVIETGQAPMRPPRIVELSALWAGPLAGRLLFLSGGDVTKVESSARPDAIRGGDPALFERLNASKQQMALDLRTAEGRAELNLLIADADIIIESSRPRALLQLGIDAEQQVRERPGLIWLTITGHGVRGEAGNWVGFGDDAAVAGGLTAALREASGALGFVGDAIADPLTGILAAQSAWRWWRAGHGGRYIFSMSGIVANALSEERGRDAQGLQNDLRNWAEMRGYPFTG